jgi:hypothetical protein
MLWRRASNALPHEPEPISMGNGACHEYNSMYADTEGTKYKVPRPQTAMQPRKPRPTLQDGHLETKASKSFRLKTNLL